MHITERLGLNSGRPVTASEGDVLNAFEQFFIEEDFLFLRWGPTITLTSDFGTTIVSVPRADQQSATVKLVMLPSSTLSPSQIKNVVAAASATQEIEQKLIVVERPDLPLFIASEVELQRPYRHDDLSRAFSDFACSTDVALGEAIWKLTDPDEAGEPVGFADRIARLRF